MREYGTVSPRFWTGATGKSLRGNPEAQVLAMYLLTNPHAEATGVYHCPMLYILHETGLSQEGASKGLKCLIEGGFCEYDEDTEFVFVVQMARFQIGHTILASDKKVAWVRRLAAAMPERFRVRFLAVHGEAFKQHSGRGIEAPSLDKIGSDRNRTDISLPDAGASGEKEKPSNGKRIPADFALTEDRIAVARTEGVAPDRTFAAFTDHWRAASGANARKRDWDAAWRNWCRKAADSRPNGGVKVGVTGETGWR